MATTTDNYDIVISLDIGYNKTKVTVNGLIFNVPSDIVDVTGKDNYIGNIKKAGYIASTYIHDTKHLIGEQARMLLGEYEYKQQQFDKVDIMNSYDRFSTQDAETHLMTCIGLALIKYTEFQKRQKCLCPNLDEPILVRKNEGNEERKDDWKIFVILGYPHDVYRRIYNAVKPNICRRHTFSIETEDQIYNLDFEIDGGKVLSYSQALAAFMGMISSDDGEIEPSNEYLKKVPCIVIDGGQKTMGIYKISSNMQIGQDSSNTQFAMNNVYERVVEEIHEKYGRPDIEVYNIVGILENDHGIITAYDAEDDSTKEVDITEMVDKYEREVCSELIDYLNENFNRLVDYKAIFVAGGTGAAFYDQLEEYITTKRENITIYLADYEFLGKKIRPDQAISVGLYKIAKHLIRTMKLEAAKKGKTASKEA